jgi:hypothetical protein
VAGDDRKPEAKPTLRPMASIQLQGLDWPFGCAKVQVGRASGVVESHDAPHWQYD